MRLFIFLTLLLLSTNAIADGHEELVHLSAHVGMGYALTLLSDQFYNKTLGISSEGSMVLSVATALLAGCAYKVLETGNVGQVTGSMGYNTIGSVGAIGTVLMFGLNLHW